MKKTLFSLIIIVGLFLVSACSSSPAEQVPVQSVAEIVGYGSTGVYQRFSAVVSVQDPIKIMKNTDAKIGEVFVTEGDEVNEGDVLFTYDTDQLNLDLEKSRLELEKLYNDIANMQNERSELENQKAKAPSDQQLQYSLEINSKDTDILEANYNAQVKQKEIESLERSLENAAIKAPSSGRIGTITDGDKYDNMGELQPVITIIQTSDLLVKGNINENNIYALTPGMEMIIRSRIDEKTWMGSLTKIDTDNPTTTQDMYYYMYDSGDANATSSRYPFIIEPYETEGMMLGQHVYVEPYNGDEGDPDIWYLPSWYIQDIETSPYVWAEDSNGKLEMRTVILGDYNQIMDSYVIADGLTPEDNIAFPTDNIHEGMLCVDYREYIPDEEQETEMSGGDQL